MGDAQQQQVDPALSNVLEKANVPLITPQEDQEQVARAAQPAAQPAAAPAAGGAPSAAPAPAPAAPGAAQPAQPAAAGSAPAQDQSRLGNIEDKGKHVLGDIFQTLAGGKKKEWQQTPNGPVATYRDLKPGEMAQGILAAAITGLASGYDPKNRGKGPAMSSAFSAGFKGEQEQRDKQADQKEQEAQKQFSNQNLSDEMVLRKQRAATEQQEAVQRMSKDAQEIQQIQQRAAEGKTLFDEGQKDRIINQVGAFESKKTAGWTEIPHPVTPGESFGFADMKEAQEYANKYGAHLLNPGEFNTAPVYNPASGLWVPMQQPKGYDELKQVRFAKMENGQPVKDPKNPGKYLSDGSKDATGRAMTPAEMTNKDYESWLTGDSKIRMDKATATEKYAMASELIAKQQKDKMLAQADSRYADAGGDPFAVNIKDGTWTMTDGDRSRLRNAAVSNLAGMEKAREAAQKELENASTADEKAAARATFEKADQGWNYYNTQLSTLNGRISKAGSLANSYIRNFSDENGYSGDKALEKFDEAVKRGDYKTSGMTPEELTRTRGNLLSAQSKAEAAKKNPLPADPMAQKAIALFQNTPKEQIAGHISDAVTKGTLTADQGDQLYKYYQLTPPPSKSQSKAQSSLEGIGSNYSMVQMPDGSQQKIGNDLVSEFVSKRGAKLIGQGTDARSSTEVEREK
jgi:hypothetical protein